MSQTKFFISLRRWCPTLEIFKKKFFLSPASSPLGWKISYFDGEDVHNLSLDRQNIERDLVKEKDDIAKNPIEYFNSQDLPAVLLRSTGSSLDESKYSIIMGVLIRAFKVLAPF